MKCDFCDEEAVLTSGYHYCQKHARGQDRIAIHNMIVDTFPSITMTRIHQLCSEMFGTEDYGFSTFPRLYAIIDRGPILKFGPRMGWYAKPQAQYLMDAFSKFLEEKHPQFWLRVKDDRIERFY